MADRVVQTENGSVTQQRDGDSGEACAEARRTLGEMPQQRYRTLEKKREAPAMIVAAGCFYNFYFCSGRGCSFTFTTHTTQISISRKFRSGGHFGGQCSPSLTNLAGFGLPSPPPTIYVCIHVSHLARASRPASGRH